MAEIEVRDRPETERYEVLVDGDVAGYSAYRRDGARIVFTHTQIVEDYAGQGVGSGLARGALDDARRQGLVVVPRCPFIRAWIGRHPAYQDLVEPG